jgi:hypothetical protein
VHEELSLVVPGTTRVDALVLVSRLEGRSNPLVERIGGLDVVMAVDENGRRVGSSSGPLARHDRVVRRLVHRRSLDAEPRQLVHDPLRGAPDLALALRIGAHALYREELVELGQVPVIVLPQVRDGGFGGVGGAGLARHRPMIGA